MRLDADDAMARFVEHDHGVLSTVHPVRGVDAVPVVYAVVSNPSGAAVGVPVDLVKPKASTRLQRERNVESDPRATLLIDHWDAEDWSRLWWVRAELRWIADPGALEDVIAEQLARRYPPYRDRPFARVLVFRVGGVSGWSAAPRGG